MESKTRKALAVGVVTIAAVGSGVAVAGAAGGGDHESPIVGEDLDRASRAALAHTGEGRVTETEIGDEDSFYEVEVTLDDGSQVDVQLDERFEVVEVMSDRDGEPDDGS